MGAQTYLVLFTNRVGHSLQNLHAYGNFLTSGLNT